MPKIHIKEIDNTQAPLRPYSNYTVVVPGFHAPYFAHTANGTDIAAAKGIILEKPTEDGTGKEVQTDSDVFGSAGIREFSSVTDFEELVGIVPPKAETISTNTEIEITVVAVANSSSYTATFIPFNPVIDEDGNKQAVSAEFSIPTVPVDGDLVVTADGVTIKFNYTTTPAAEEGQPDTHTATSIASFTYNGKTYTCEANTITGTYDATLELSIDLPAHYGNQIAYELLNMGYTIYYVNMGEFYPDKTGGAGKTAIFNVLKELGSDEFWEDLRDKTTYDFRFVLTGFIEGGNADTRAYYNYMQEANRAISTLASYENAPDDTTDVFTHTKKRGDCVALLDLDEAAIERTANFGLSDGAVVTTKKIVSAIKTEINTLPASADKYSAVFCPSVTYSNNSRAGVEGSKPGTIGYNNRRFPASFHYLACFDNMLANNYREWFAAAGFTRGAATYTVASTYFDLGDLAVQALEPRFKNDKDIIPIDKAVNVIVRNLNSYYIWGNRTCELLDKELVASHFLNIRQLCISIKKYVYTLCRNFSFDPNSDMLWLNFTNALKPLLEQMKANQGIRSYKLTKRNTGLKGTLGATITIVPIEAVEDFDIELVLEDATEGTSATVTD